MTDDYDLQRFLTAQDSVYDEALAILRGGAMCSTFMDFIFPRLLDGDRYGIASLDEARGVSRVSRARPAVSGMCRGAVMAVGRDAGHGLRRG